MAAKSRKAPPPRRGAAASSTRSAGASARAAKAPTREKARAAPSQQAKKRAKKPAPRRATRSRPAGAGRVEGASRDQVLARDIMLREVITVSHAAPLSEVESILSENRISGVPVVNPAGRIIGVVSIRDLLERYTEDPDARPRRGGGYYRVPTEDMSDLELDAFQVPPEAEETARDVMSAEVYTVPEDTPLPEIARQMHGHRIHRILVVDAAARCTGLISTFEILGAVAEQA